MRSTIIVVVVVVVIIVIVSFILFIIIFPVFVQRWTVCAGTLASFSLTLHDPVWETSPTSLLLFYRWSNRDSRLGVTCLRSRVATQLHLVSLSSAFPGAWGSKCLGGLGSGSLGFTAMKVLVDQLNKGQSNQVPCRFRCAQGTSAPEREKQHR